MSGNSIFTVTKGKTERVTLPDRESAIDLMHALNVLDCYESVTRQEIQGNREDLVLYEVGFLGKNIKVVGQADCEKVIHWLFTYGCKKISAEKLVEKEIEDGREGSIVCDHSGKGIQEAD